MKKFWELFRENQYWGENGGAGLPQISILKRFFNALKGGYGLCRMILPFTPSGRVYGLFSLLQRGGIYA
jgi:hypothetical protein